MREYETIYVLKPDLPENISNNLKEKITGSIQKGQGHLLTFTDWGKRKLAYQIHKFRKAHYFYLQYLATGPLVFEIERFLKFDDSVLRFLTVQLKKEVDVKERTAKPVEAPQPPEEMHARDLEGPSFSRRGPGERYPSEGSEMEPPMINLDEDRRS